MILKNMAQNIMYKLEFPMISMLTLTFVILKLTKTIDWSWWWVLSPIWISTIGAIIVGIGAIILVVVIDLIWGKKL